MTQLSQRAAWYDLAQSKVNEMKTLDVETSKQQFTAAILLGLFIVPMSFLTMSSAMRRGFRIAPFTLGFAMLTVYVFVLWLVRRARARSVKRFSPEGLQRFDGQSFAWSDLTRVVKQIKKRGYRRFYWRTEIQFANGKSAWLLPGSISNLEEVSAYIEGLPCEHTEVVVG
jgi:hypothetical protein